MPAASPSALLRIVQRDPLTLAGEAFGAHEIVRVSVDSGASKTRSLKVSADAQGHFTLAFEDLKLDRYSGELEVVAVGSRGSEASFVLHRLHGGSRADV